MTTIKKKRVLMKMALDYTRSSGDPNTSLGNTLINALCFNFLFVKTMPDPVFYAHHKQRISTAFMLGDDNLFGLDGPKPDVNNIIKQYATLGLEVKVILHDDLFKTTFLS